MAQFYDNLSNSSLWNHRLSSGGDSFNFSPTLSIQKGSASGNNVFSYNAIDGISDIDIFTEFEIHDTQQVGSYGFIYTQNYALQFQKVGGMLSVLLDCETNGAVTVAHYNFNWSLSTPYRARFRVTGTHLQAKLWHANTSEPSIWPIDTNYPATDTSSNSYNGVGTYVANHTINFTAFGAGTNGDVAPTQPVSNINTNNPTNNILYDNVSVSYNASIADNNAYMQPKFDSVKVEQNIPPSSADIPGHGTYIGSTSPLGSTVWGSIVNSSIEHYTLEVNDFSYNIQYDNIDAPQIHTLNIYNPIHDINCDKVILHQLNVVHPNNSAHNIHSNELWIIHNKTIKIDNSDHTANIDYGYINQNNTLGVLNSLIKINSTSDKLYQHNIITVDESNINEFFDNTILNQYILLHKPNDGVHNINMCSNIVYAVQNVLIDNALHKLNISSPYNVLNWSDYNKYYGIYKDSRNSIVGGNLELSEYDSGNIKRNIIDSGTLLSNRKLLNVISEDNYYINSEDSMYGISEELRNGDTNSMISNGILKKEKIDNGQL